MPPLPEHGPAESTCTSEEPVDRRESSDLALSSWTSGLNRKTFQPLSGDLPVQFAKSRVFFNFAVFSFFFVLLEIVAENRYLEPLLRSFTRNPPLGVVC